MKKFRNSLISIIILFLTLHLLCMAHPGRTDQNGGHWDRSTGTYHFHTGEYAGRTSSDSSSDSEYVPFTPPYEPPKDNPQKDNSNDTAIESNKTSSEQSTFSVQSILIVVALVLISLILIYKFFKNYKKEHENEINKYKKQINDLKFQLVCEENKEIVCLDNKMLRYYVKIRHKGKEKEYTKIAEIIASTYRVFAQDDAGIIREIESDMISYYLQKVYWNDKGYSNFDDKDSRFPLYKLKMYEYIPCTATDDKEYEVMLTLDKEESNKRDLDNLANKRKELNKFYNDRNKEFEETFNTTKINYTYLAKLVSEFEEYFYKKIADELINKKPPALKGAEQVRELAQKIKEVKKENIILKGKITEYEKEKSKNKNLN